MCQYRDARDPDHSDCDASKEQYRRQFKKWKFEKNLRADQWIKIVKAVRNRKSYGKDSEILLTLGRVANKEGRLSDRKLRKEMSRYRSREHDDCSGKQFRQRCSTKTLTWLADITNEDMDGIIIGTPQGEDVQAINYLQIPWFRSQALIEPYCQSSDFPACCLLALIVPS